MMLRKLLRFNYGPFKENRSNAHKIYTDASKYDLIGCDSNGDQWNFITEWNPLGCIDIFTKH